MFTVLESKFTYNRPEGRKGRKGKIANISGGPILSSSTFYFLADPLKITNFVNFLKFFWFCHLSWSEWQIKNLFLHNKFAGEIDYVCCSLNIKKGINYTSCGIALENIASKCNQLVLPCILRRIFMKICKI
jgi:hypothetical protein